MLETHVLTFSTDLDISEKWLLRDQFLKIEHFSAGSTTIVDLSRVRFIDTTLINALIHTQKKIVHARKSIYLVSAAGSMPARLIELTGMARAFPMFPDVATARRFIEGAARRTHRSFRATFQADTERHRTLGLRLN